MPRYLRDYLKIITAGLGGSVPAAVEQPAGMSSTPLILVSNRGPVTFGPGGEVKRGGGGLVTALTGLASHREAVWIASAMSDEDVAKSEESGGRPFTVDSPARRLVPGAARRVGPDRVRPLLQRLREPDAVVHPALPLGPVERAGHPAQRGRGVRVRLQRRQRGPRGGGVRGDRGRRRAGRDGPRLPPLHAAGASCGARGPTRSCTTSSTSRGRSPTRGACCRAGSGARSSRACCPTTSSASTRARTAGTSCSAAAT